jgi:serine phosphatase RsbU (regulator of sigma subunit)
VAGEQFGSDRLNRAFAAASRMAPDAIVNHVATTVERFEAGAPPEDDLTLLALQYRGRQGPRQEARSVKDEVQR